MGKMVDGSCHNEANPLGEGTSDYPTKITMVSDVGVRHVPTRTNAYEDLPWAVSDALGAAPNPGPAVTSSPASSG